MSHRESYGSLLINNMIRFIISVILYLASVQLCHSMPAYPHLTKVWQDGEWVSIFIKGDENFKYGLSQDGYLILPTENGWFYADYKAEGKFSISKYLVTNKNYHNEELQKFLSKQPKDTDKFGALETLRKESFHKQSKRGTQSPAIGSRKALVILMQFQDVKFNKTASDFSNLFNQENYSEDGAIGSVYDYYKYVSYGLLDLQSDIIGPFNAKNQMSYYGRNTGLGNNDKSPYELFQEAIQYAQNEVQLANYDADNDGYVDNIHIIYAGYGEEAGASTDAIWAHEMTFRTITVQGMKIDRYSCAPELRGNRGNGISRIGPHCHEIGHALGAMDYYDTDYETGGYYQGTGQWDIMASGSWNNDGISPADFNPYVKVYNYGWTEAKSLKENNINIIGISSERGNIYRIDTGTKNDFFLLENRDGEYFHSGEPGKGLLIFHIGPNLESRAKSNTINTTYPQQCYVVCASSNYRKPSSSSTSYGSINSAGCPYPGSSQKTEFSDYSTPAAYTISGKTTGISLKNISYDGQDIKFSYGNSPEGDQEEPPTTPDESYLWGEDFEHLRMPAGWEYSDIIGKGKYEIVRKVFSNDIPSSPDAASGTNYLKYVSLSNSSLGKKRTIGKFVTPRIKLANDRKYNISLMVRKYSPKEDSQDTIQVYLVNEFGDKVTDLITESQISQDAWSNISVLLPSNNDVFFIEIDFRTNIGTSFFIDKILISEYSEDTHVSDIESRPFIKILDNGFYINCSTKKEIEVYTINGKKVFEDCLERGYVYLRQGAYIVKVGRGRGRERAKTILIKNQY